MKNRDLREMKSVRIRKYEEFLNESYDRMQSDDLQRFYFLTHEKYSSDKPLGKMIVEIRNGLFDQILLTSSNAMKLTLDPGIPVLNFTEDNDLIEKMIDKGIIDKKNLYNNPENSTLVSDKAIFHKTFGDQGFVPKTVFSIDEVEDLKFPIIAKPAKGRSAEGIQKFDSADDLKKSKEKFDLFSEMIDIDKEYRCFCFKNDVLSLDRRDKVEGSEDFLADTKTATDFIYNSINISNYEKKKMLEELIKSCRKLVNLDFFSIDFAEDSNGDLWLIEMNSRTGMGADKMVNLYRKIYDDYYGKGVEKAQEKALQNIEKDWKKLYSSEKGSGSLNECIAIAGQVDGSKFLFKNRDRSFTPQSKVAREMLGDTEIVYYTDQLGWMEGMNSHGVGFVFTQLTVQEWKGYKHSYTVTDDPKPLSFQKVKTDGFKKFADGVKKALKCKTAKDALEELIKSEKSGSYLVSDKDEVYELEIFNGKVEKALRDFSQSPIYVKSNHGELLPEAGHQPSGESVKRAVSSIRKHQATMQLQGMKSVDEVARRMKFQAFDSSSPLNVFRTDIEEHTISQCLMDLTNLRFCFYHDDQTADSVEVIENSKDPVIKIEIYRYTK
jgi:hypothetical protein